MFVYETTDFGYLHEGTSKQYTLIQLLKDLIFSHFLVRNYLCDGNRKQ